VKQISATQAAGLTIFVLLIMFILKRLGGASRSMRRAADDIRGPATRAVTDFLDGPAHRS
jgi:hypothetical protein